jgi:hypothetical protein
MPKRWLPVPRFPLERELTVVGPVRAMVYASSSAPDTDHLGSRLRLQVRPSRLAHPPRARSDLVISGRSRMGRRGRAVQARGRGSGSTSRSAVGHAVCGHSNGKLISNLEAHFTIDRVGIHAPIDVSARLGETRLTNHGGAVHGRPIEDSARAASETGRSPRARSGTSVAPGRRWRVESRPRQNSCCGSISPGNPTSTTGR